MKKNPIFIINLIFVLLASSVCFATTDVIDSVTGDVVSTFDGDTSIANTVKITQKISYRKSDKMFLYDIGLTGSDYIAISIYDKEYTTGPVTIASNNDEKVSVYKDGELIDISLGGDYSLPGEYIVMLAESKETIANFTILNDKFGNIESISFPDIYLMSNIRYQGKSISFSDMHKADIKSEGAYIITYVNKCDKSIRQLEFEIDRTAPVLEIEGVENGEAYSVVTLGDTEDGSSLVIYCNRKEISNKTTLNTPGEYVIEYKDDAGNMSTYEFTIHMFLDINSKLVVAIAGFIFLATAGYMIFKRRSMRVA